MTLRADDSRRRRLRPERKRRSADPVCASSSSRTGAALVGWPGHCGPRATRSPGPVCRLRRGAVRRAALCRCVSLKGRAGRKSHSAARVVARSGRSQRADKASKQPPVGADRFEADRASETPLPHCVPQR
jgi:hypothetical protein